MRIGLDLRMAGGGSGIDRYITELAHQVLKQDRTNNYVLFFRDARLAENYKQYNQKIVIADIPHYSFAEQIKFPAILRAEKLDLVHFPHFNVPIFYNAAFIVTIHDLTHTLFPGRKMSRLPHRLAYNWVFNHAIKASKKIIAVSNSTKREIIDRFRVDERKIQVVYEGYNEIYKMTDKAAAFQVVSQKFKISKPYLLYVGVWRRYKNLPMLAHVFDRLRAVRLDFQLVLVGEPDQFYPEIEQQIFSIKHQNDIKALGRISDADLTQVYNAAELFVLPSLTEGFGLTPLEAAVCGTALALSDIPTLREIMGQAAEYFDPNDENNMFDVLKQLLEHPNRREELANAGLRRVRHFSWQLSATETIRVYAEAVQ